MTEGDKGEESSSDNEEGADIEVEQSEEDDVMSPPSGVNADDFDTSIK